MLLNRKSIIVIFVSLAIIFLGSCAKLRRIVIHDNAETILKKELKISYDNKIIPKYILVENASIKIEGEETNRARINFYLEKDKQIFFNVKLLGFEMFRFQLTKDSVKYINRISREFYFGNLINDQEELTKLLNYANLENLVATGFLLNEDAGFDNFFNKSKIEGDKIFFGDDLGPGQNVLCSYSLKGLQILDLDYLDYVKQVETKLFFDRAEHNLNSIRGFYKNGSSVTNFDLDISEIKNIEFLKTDFRVGRNYHEIESLL